MADGHGKVWTFGPNDATLRRRGDKVVIESAGAGLSAGRRRGRARRGGDRLMRTRATAASPRSRSSMCPAAARLASSRSIPGCRPSTPSSRRRPASTSSACSCTSAQGGRLDGEPPDPRGVAIQARLNAEDPERGFAPAPGVVARLRLGAGPGVRVDAAVAEGDVLAPGGPMLVAQMLAWGPSRDEARVRLRRALDETTVVIDGGSTNKGFLLDVLDRPEVREARVDNAFVDRLAANGEIAVERDADLALLVAAIDAYETERGVDQARFFASAHRGRPRTAPEVGRTVELRHRGHGYRVHVTRRGPNTLRRRARRSDGGDPPRAARTVRAAAAPRIRDRRGSCRPCRATSTSSRSTAHPTGSAATTRASCARRRRAWSSPCPSAPATRSRPAIPVAVIESMKMETAVPAPFTGRVRRLLAGPNEQVDTGAALVQLDPTGPDPDAEHPAARLDRAGDRTSRRSRRQGRAAGATSRSCAAWCSATTSTSADARADGRRPGGGVARPRPRPRRSIAAEQDVLVAFADLRVLFRRVRDEADADVQVRAPQEHLHAYLRSLDVEGEGLPAPFLAALRRALGHYGVDDLERTPALEEALYWIHQSQQRVDAQIPVVVDILERWLEQGPQGDAIDDARRGTLDALVAATQRRHPVVADLAREVRFGIVDEPRLRAARDAMYEAMDGHLAALVGRPRRPEARRAHGRARRVPATARAAAAAPPGGRPAGHPSRRARDDDPPVLPPPRSPGRAPAHRRRARRGGRVDDTRAGGGPHARAHHRRPAVRAGGRRERARQGRRRASRPASRSPSTCTRGRTTASDDRPVAGRAGRDPRARRSPPARSRWSWPWAAPVRRTTSARCAT